MTQEISQGVPTSGKQVCDNVLRPSLRTGYRGPTVLPEGGTQTDPTSHAPSVFRGRPISSGWGVPLRPLLARRWLGDRSHVLGPGTTVDTDKQTPKGHRSTVYVQREVRNPHLRQQSTLTRHPPIERKEDLNPTGRHTSGYCQRVRKAPRPYDTRAQDLPRRVDPSRVPGAPPVSQDLTSLNGKKRRNTKPPFLSRHRSRCDPRRRERTLSSSTNTRQVHTRRPPSPTRRPSVNSFSVEVRGSSVTDDRDRKRRKDT